MDYRLIIKNPKLFHLITDDMKKLLMLGGMNTVNTQAFLTRKNAIQNIKNQFTLRNGFTAKNIQVTKCTEASRIEDIKAEVGATENIEYMERQEKGGEHKAENKKLAIPTDASRTGGNKAGVVARKMRMGSLLNKKLDSAKAKTNFVSRSARTVANAYVAQKKNKVIHFGSDLYQITSFVKNGSNIQFNKVMLRNMDYSSTHTEASPWLEPASEKPTMDAQNIFNSQMKKLEKKK